MAQVWRWFEVEDRVYRATPDWERVEMWDARSKAWGTYHGDPERWLLQAEELKSDPTTNLLRGRAATEG